jgi:restriction endonuclease S subunit
MKNVSEYIQENKDRFISELVELLKIPSISADSKYKSSVMDAAEAVRETLEAAGADNTELCETEGYPVVYGEKMIDPNKPTILVYGHYDVQPPDPLELWDSPPFEPVIKDNKIFARGAADDKGQMYMHVKAFELMMKTDQLPCNVKFIIEGEEEVGSISLEKFIAINKEKLSRFIIPIPPKEEQTTIANFLDYKTEKINRFIKKKKQLIKVLNEQKSTITIQAVTKGLDPNVRMKNSGTKWLGNVPEHWEVKKLKYVANCFPSNVDKHSLEDEKEVRLCNYTDVYKNDFITNNMELMIATAKDDQIQKFALKKGDVIITKDSETADDIANPALVIEDLENVICGYHLSIMRPYSKLKGEYLLRALQCKPINVQFELCSNGVTRVGLGVADMKKAQIPLPPIEEQNDISSFIQSELNTINKTISTIEKEITLVEEYKTALIAEAVTGKIDVRDFKIPTGGTPLAMVAEEAINYKRVNKNE